MPDTFTHTLQVEILVEEESMRHFLEGFLPSVLPADIVLNNNCFIRPHQGKQDLRASLQKKVRTYPFWPYAVRLIVVHDQDANDCIQLKNDLVALVRKSNQTLPLLVRIACRELENWYLGDLEAVEQAYPESRASTLVAKAKFRNPDRLNGAEEMRHLLASNFSKIQAAQRISPYMAIERNRSVSFQQFVQGIQNFLSLPDPE